MKIRSIAKCYSRDFVQDWYINMNRKSTCLVQGETYLLWMVRKNQMFALSTLMLKWWSCVDSTCNLYFKMYLWEKQMVSFEKNLKHQCLYLFYFHFLFPCIQDIHCKYSMFLDPTEIKTEVIKGTTMPAFKHSKYFNFDLVTSQVGGQFISSWERPWRHWAQPRGWKLPNWSCLRQPHGFFLNDTQVIPASDNHLLLQYALTSQLFSKFDKV